MNRFWATFERYTRVYRQIFISQKNKQVFLFSLNKKPFSGLSYAYISAPVGNISRIKVKLKLSQVVIAFRG